MRPKAFGFVPCPATASYPNPNLGPTPTQPEPQVTLHTPINSFISMAGDMGTPEVDMHALHSGDVSQLDDDNDVGGSTSGGSGGGGSGGQGGGAGAGAAGTSEGSTMTPVRPNRVPSAGGQPEAYIEIEWTPDWTP